MNAGILNAGIQPGDPDDWDPSRRILVVLAHPDDPEFFCGASIARWTHAGHEVKYCLLTCGDKGTKDLNLQGEELCSLRQREQKTAAAVLGVKEITFLDFEDGYLVPDLELRRAITRVIRREHPDVLVTCDPTTLFIGFDRLNHPDHRAAGQAALDAVYPAVRDHLNFVELWRDEKLEPCLVNEIWVAGTLEPNVVLNITPFWETKLQALYEHNSQIGERMAFDARMRARRTPDSTPEHPRYEEKFRRILLG